jgi:hypothetical protein
LIAVGRSRPDDVDAEDFSRRLGNWGGASHLIGDRWEALVPALLRRHLPWGAPTSAGRATLIHAVLALDADPQAGRRLQRAGVSAPDLLLVGQLGGGAAARPVLRAADCKVSLDTADQAQTAPARLQVTMARIGAAFGEVAEALRCQAELLPEPQRALVLAALAAALRGDWQAVLPGEGLFVAPDNGFNRWFLGRLERRRRTGAPLGRLPRAGPRRAPGDVSGPVDAAQAARLLLPAHLEPVSAAEFLGGLAGWPEAALVAELDGVSLEQVDLAVAERCWRVGVGLRGGVLALGRPLFQPALPAVRPDGRPRDVVGLLLKLVSRRRPHDSASLVAAVARVLDARRPLWQREAALLQAPLSYGAWMALLVEAVGEDALRPPTGDRGDGDGPPLSGRALYREMAARHRRRVLAAAAELATAGHDEQTILRLLEERRDEWRAAAQADAVHLTK